MLASQGSGRHEGTVPGDAAGLSQSGAMQMHAQFPSTQVMSPPQRSQQQGNTAVAAQPIGGGGMTQQQMLLYQHQLLLHHQQLQQQQVQQQQQQQMHQQQQQQQQHAPLSGSKRKSAGGSRPGSIGEGRPSPTVPSSPNPPSGDPALKRQRQLSSEGVTSPAAAMATALSPQLSVMSSNSGATHQRLALQEQQQGAFLSPPLSALQARTSFTSPYQRPSDEFASSAAVTSPGSTVAAAAAVGLGSPPQSASAVQLQNQLVEQMRINQQLLAQQSQLLELRREQELMQHQQRMLMHQQQFERQQQKTQQQPHQQQQQQQELQGQQPELEQQEQPQQPQPHPHSPQHQALQQEQQPSTSSWGLGDPSDVHPELPPLTRRTSSLFDESPSPSAPTVPPPSVRRFTPSPSVSPSGPMDALGTPLLIQIHSRMGNGADHDGGGAAAAPSGEFLLAPAVSSLIGQSSSPLASPTSSLAAAGPGRIGNLGGPSVVAMGLGPGAGAGGSLAAASVAKIMCGAAGPMSPQSLPLASGPSTPNALAPGSGGGSGGGEGGQGTEAAAVGKSHTTPGRRPKAKEQHSALRVGSLRGGTTPKAKAHHHHHHAHAHPHSHAHVHPHPHQAHEQKSATREESEDADMTGNSAAHSKVAPAQSPLKSESKVKTEATASAADPVNDHGDEADMHTDADSTSHHSAAAGVKAEEHESAEGSATDDDDDDDSDSSNSSNDDEEQEEQDSSEEEEEEEEEYRSKGKRKPAPKGTKRPASKALKKPGLSRGTSSTSVVSSAAGHKSASGANKEGAKMKTKREKGVSCHQVGTTHTHAPSVTHRAHCTLGTLHSCSV